MSDLYIKLNTN